MSNQMCANKVDLVGNKACALYGSDSFRPIFSVRFLTNYKVFELLCIQAEFWTVISHACSHIELVFLCSSFTWYSHRLKLRMPTSQILEFGSIFEGGNLLRDENVLDHVINLQQGFPPTRRQLFQNYSPLLSLPFLQYM